MRGVINPRIMRFLFSRVLAPPHAWFQRSEAFKRKKFRLMLTDGVGGARLRSLRDVAHLPRIEPNFEQVVEKGEERCQRERDDKQRHVSKLDEEFVKVFEGPISATRQTKRQGCVLMPVRAKCTTDKTRVQVKKFVYA